MKISWFTCHGVFLIFTTLTPCLAQVTWDNSNASGEWFTAANWDTNVEPTPADDVIFPLGLAGSITLANGELAKSLQFNDAYTLGSGGLTLSTASTINVASAITTTINTPLVLTGGSSKTGDGTLVLGGSNTNATGIAINAGRLRITHVSALGAAGATVNAGTFLEISGTISPNTPISLKQGGTVSGFGTPTSNGVLTIDPLATAVTLATDVSTDVFTLATAANELTGGSASTVITTGGAGAIRLNSASNYAGSWNLPAGRLDLASITALGSDASRSVTLSGGVLSGRTTSAISFTGSPGNNLLVTADTTLLSDRSSVGAGLTYTFGALSMAGQTLTVAPGVNSTSGTAAITLGNVTLSGNPAFAINDSGATNGKLTTGSLIGGGLARSIIKSGAGDLAVTGGATDLPSGSSFTASGGGVVEMLFPALGSDATIAVTAVQHPFGAASLSLTGGSLVMAADGASNSTTQVYQVASAINLSGNVIMDSNRRSGSGTNKSFELPGLSLADGTELSISGTSSHSLRLSAPLALAGNATIRGIDLATKTGALILDAGISGIPATTLTTGGGTSPLNLTLNAASTYGGGTLINGGNIILNSANALGSGSITLNGGTLRSNSPTYLSTYSVMLDGGTLDLRNNTGNTFTFGALSLNGDSTLNIANNGSGSSQVFTIPVLDVAGDATLTLTNANSFVPLLSSIELAGNLTLSNAITARVVSISEDINPRAFLKTGAGLLELEGASTHSGGTEVLAGTLLVEHTSALGSGDLTVGATSGTATATAQFLTGLTIANDIIIRSGSSGAATLDSPTGGVTWNGGLSLQKDVIFDNGSLVSTYAGVIGGSGAISKISGGEWVLGNAANSFVGNISISAGTLTAATNGALGNAANGVNLTSSGILKISGTFSSGRTISVTGTAADVNVTAGNTLTLTAPAAGAGTFAKGDAGTLEFAPSVDGSARGASLNQLNAGTLRLQGALNLGNASPLTLAAGTLELLNDANTDFAHPVTTTTATTTIHVDRAAGGAASNGRHTLGALSATTSNLTVTGANGFGLTLDSYTTTSSSFITNNAPGVLVLSDLTGNPGTSSRTLTIGGNGDTEVAGATSEGAGTGSYGIIKEGSGRFTLGTSVTDFNRILTVEDGVVDLNGLSLSTTGLVTLGGAASLSGARIETGVGGSLNPGAGITFSNSLNPAGALITGAIGIGAIPQTFTVNDSSGAAVDLTLDGPITGAVGSSISKTGSGTLRLTGTGNTLPGLFSTSAGLLELGKSAGNAIGTGGLAITGGTTRLLAAGQMDDSAAVSLSSASEVFLELNNFTETTGPLSLTQTDTNDYSAVKTGAAGTLVLNGNLTLNNNTNSSGTDGREVLITGTGGESTPTSDGFLDLGGATRTIHVATTTVGVNEMKANATIETQIINGGILKTGPRTLNLTHPNNTFAGGLQIAEGTVKPAVPGSLGAGAVTFTNAPGTSAGIDFGTLSSTFSNPINTGTGDFTLTYSALAPNVLTLSGGINLQQNFTINVVNGSVQNGSPFDVLRAVVDVTGPIADDADTFGIIKTGDGMLKLAAGNTFDGGTLVQRGILSLAADSSLGDSTAPLTLNGGCLAASNSFTLTRDLTIGANGGSLRANSTRAMEITGALDWGSATTGTDGGGRIVISGSTTGSGNLIVGESIAFAAGAVGQVLTWNARVCLQGPAALPSGNLSFGGNGILELGNGDFTRPLGTGPGEVQMPTNVGGGWAAIGADRVVNIGGAGAALTWGQVSPPFFYKDGPSTGDYGQIILGSSNATHTVEFQNPLVVIQSNRGITCYDGAAVVDARVTGDISNPDLVYTSSIQTTGNGTLEITGDFLGRMRISQNGEGTTIISGNNTGLEDISVFVGTLKFANQASVGALESIFVPFSELGSVLDATALPSPLSLATDGQIWVDGQIAGDVLVNGGLLGTGEVTGDVTVPAGSFVYPQYNGMLHIGGDLTAQDASSLEFEVLGTLPEEDFNRMRVTGAVNLEGLIYLYGGFGLLENDSMVLILNDGTDPINGIFDGLPEGAAIPIGNGLALQVTYQANGDGGATGNDFGVTVVEFIPGSDLNLTADGPLVVVPGAPVTTTFTVSNPGPNIANGLSLVIELPANAVFVESSPPGTLNGTTLTLVLPSIDVGLAGQVSVTVTAPAAPAAVRVDASIDGAFDDPNSLDNSSAFVTAVIDGADFELDTFTALPGSGQLTMGFDTIDGVTYRFQRSINLDVWDDQFDFVGDGLPYEHIEPVDDTKEFFRFIIIPYVFDQGGGGGGE